MNNFFEKYNFNVFLKPLFFISLLFLGEITATEIVILYAIETIVGGLFHVVKMFFISFLTGKDSKQKLLGMFYTAFFSVHYGIFVFVQTTFFFVFLAMEDKNISSSIGLENFKTILQLPGFQVGLIFMIFSYALRFYFIFFGLIITEQCKLNPIFSNLICGFSFNNLSPLFQDFSSFLVKPALQRQFF